MTRIRILAAVLAAVAGMLAVGGCTGYSDGFFPAPAGGPLVRVLPAQAAPVAPVINIVPVVPVPMVPPPGRAP